MFDTIQSIPKTFYMQSIPIKCIAQVLPNPFPKNRKWQTDLIGHLLEYLVHRQQSNLIHR